MIRLDYHVNSVFNAVSYLLIDEESNECMLIDVGDYDVIKQMLAGLTLKGVLLTHVHFDHIYGLNGLVEDNPLVPIYTNGFGASSLVNPSDNLSKYHEDPFVLSPKAKVEVIRDGKALVLGGEEIRIHETPGHDPSCMCFVCNEYIFTGDAYIPGVKVFTKFQNGDKKQAAESLERLQGLERSGFKVMPGHWIENNEN